MQNRQATQLLFELSRPGCRAEQLPACDVLQRPLEELLPAGAVADGPPPLPELAELDLVRHFVNLSTQNMSVDTHFYPLGSCTMKYNPKRNERLAALPGFADVHPYQPEATFQGLLEILYAVQEMLAEIAGLPAVSLQPAAGAHGEMTALLMAAAYFRDLGQKRTTVLIPDAAHGTNPASAHMAGFTAVEVKTCARGLVDLKDLAGRLDDRTAVFMITNPNTLGLFDGQIAEIARMVHDAGALVYLDGANMNAILGIARPGDFGADMMHFNPHKTFSGPHGGGGPGAGPVAASEKLAPYLPAPIVVKEADRYRLDGERPKSIGRVRSFFGNTGVLVRTYCYLRTHGHDGLRRVAENAVLNANYLLSRLKHFLAAPYGDRCLHEFVVSASRLKAERGVSAMDLAKRLLDYGFHAPTVYFPLIVREALMIEPTETESKATLDAFAEALFRITGEPADLLHEAPHTTIVSRPDEVRAAPAGAEGKGRLMKDERGAKPSIIHHSSFITHHSSVPPCRFVLSPPASGPWNMAADEWLLGRAAAGDGACFRLYRWAEPTLSLGYFQDADDRHQRSHLSGAAVVRRISGGGAILHDRELTYCLTLPATHPLTHGRHALYRAVHESIVAAIGEMGIAASLCPPVPSDAERQPFLCFQRRTAGDVLVGDAKVAGSAQRRLEGAILQHGSILLGRSANAPELPGLEDLVGTDITEGQIIHHWMNKLADHLAWSWQPDTLSDAEQRGVACLAVDKYASPHWTQGRFRGNPPELL